MRLGRLFELAVAAGKRQDTRAKVTGYADSALLYGDPATEVRSCLVGIDIEVAELLLCDRLRQTRRIDCVIAHHPEGTAYAGLFKVMELQADLLEKAGMDSRSARGFLQERTAEVERKLSSANHQRAVDAAKLLDIPFICAHTAADNCASAFITRLLAKKKPATVGKIVDILLGIPEYKLAAADCAGPKIVLGNSRRAPGRIFVEFTGGTEGPKDAYKPLSKAGVGTLVSMHISEDHLRNMRAADMNAVIAGHISSDNLGMNLMLDAVQKEGKLDIIPCSGFRRIER